MVSPGFTNEQGGIVAGASRKRSLPSLLIGCETDFICRRRTSVRVEGDLAIAAISKRNGTSTNMVKAKCQIGFGQNAKRAHLGVFLSTWRRNSSNSSHENGFASINREAREHCRPSKNCLAMPPNRRI